MKTSRKGKIALIVTEGVVDTPYLDSQNVWTIGIGVTKSAGWIDPEQHKGKQFSISAMFDAFDKVLPTYEGIVNRLVKVKLQQHEFDALVHFVYNIGEANFRKSALLRNLNSGMLKAEAFRTGFHGWLKQPELRSRRDKERDMAIHAKYGSTVAPLYTVNSSFKPVRKGQVDLATAMRPTGPSAPVPPTTSPVAETRPTLLGWLKSWWS